MPKLTPEELILYKKLDRDYDHEQPHAEVDLE